jgi:4-amino-4-deoxy-L-arabinose transferase-like glycosyltransferase
MKRVRWEALAVAALAIMALAIRLPYLATIPILTDEFRVIGLALDIADGVSYPIVQRASYVGPLWIYLNGFVLRHIGSGVYTPRLMVMLFGVLTVVATYFMAREIARGDRRVAAVTALLLTFNPQHIYWNSHVAWSNHITPFFTTLAILAYVYATRRERPRWLVAAGVLYACAVQAHPTTLVLVPAFLIDFFWSSRTRALLRSPWPYAAVAAALAVYSPVIVHNLTTGFGSLRDAAVRDYAFQPTLAPGELTRRAVEFDRRLAYITFGLPLRPFEQDWYYNAVAVLFLGIMAATLGWFTRARDRFPAIVLLASGMTLLIINRQYEGQVHGRYLAYLLPLIFTVWATAGVAAWDYARSKWGTAAVERARLAAVGIVLIALLGMLIVLPPVRLFGLYDSFTRGNRSEDAWLDMVGRAVREPESPVYMTHDLAQNRTGRALLYYWRLERRPVTVLDREDSLSETLAGDGGGLGVDAFVVAPTALGASVPGLKVEVTTMSRCANNCRNVVEVSLFRWAGGGH